MEVWIYLALGAALVSAILNLSIKDLSGKIDEYAAGFIRNLILLPALWLILIVFGFPKVDYTFWILIAIMLPFEFVLVNLFQKAFKLSPVSLIVPILSLSPLFIALISFILFSEKLTFYHILALIAFVVGVYILNLKSTTTHIFAPIKSLFEDKGVFYIFLVALILGVTVTLGKRAIVASSPQFFSAIYYTFVTLLLFPLYKYKSKVRLSDFFRHKKSIFLLGILGPVSLMLVFFALKMGPTAVVQSVKSLDVIFSVILAGTFLKEKGIRKRLIGSAFIVAGSILIILK